MAALPLSVRLGEVDQQTQRVATAGTQRMGPITAGPSTRFPGAREQPLPRAAKAEIDRKADDPDHENAGKDALSAKRLLSLRHHVAGSLDADVETDPAAAPHRPW